jgi:two-component system chemotaxis sensor kinase CheA
MSSFANDDALIREFVTESQEHLSDIEPDLLELEKQGASIDQDRVNRIFRAIHSIKGAAGFFGFENLKRTSHVMESVLMRIRDGQLVPTPNIVEPLLQGVDLLRDMVDDVASSEAVASQGIVDTLNTILEGKPTEASSAEGSPAKGKKAKAPQGGQPPVLPDETVINALKKGQHLFTLTIDVAKDLAPQQRSFEQLKAVVASVGSILGVSQPETANKVRLVLATVLELDLIAPAFDLPPTAVTLFEPDAALVAKAKASQPALPNMIALAGNPTGAKPATPPPAEAPKSQAPAESTESIRVRVDLLNKLMDFAGELVLSRNQLIRALSQGDGKSTHGLDVENLTRIVQNVDLVTSNIQEHIMQTRMQPIESVFRKFPRVVRDLANQLGKQISLEMSGQDVELDKSILESLSDPLTHVIRNCCDHGIESPTDRQAAGKSPVGLISLRAYHEGGQINVVVDDDGKGIATDRVADKAIRLGVITREQYQAMSPQEQLNLIFHPGLSTADQISDVSGRGVGMDVVKTNIERFGGHISLESTPGKGTSLRMQLPLTLAIIPSLVVGIGERKFAIPQVNLLELVRVRASDIQSKIERVGRASVLRLRGRLLPLVHLSDALNLPRQFSDPATGEVKPDRRQTLDDARTRDPEFHPVPEAEQRQHYTSDYNILVLRIGTNQYGLVVDKVFDTEEIVVKPLSNYLKNTKCYSGTTIMGDGSVAMILDAGGVASTVKLNFAELEAEEQRRASHMSLVKSQQGEGAGHQQSVILFANHPDERFALPLDELLRLEKITPSDIAIVGNREFVTYRGESLPLLRLEDYLPIRPTEMLEEDGEAYIILPKRGNGRVGLYASKIIDTANVAQALNQQLFSDRELSGSAMINDHLTLFINVEALLDRAGIVTDDELLAEEQHMLLSV